jgi:hypothetical protein
MPKEHTHDILSPPQPGIFMLRLVRKGQRVPARIILENGWWRAEINGVEEGPRVEDPLASRSIVRIWESGQMVSQEVFDHALALKAWAEKNDPTHPAANPRQPVDLTKMQPVWS